MIDRDIFFDSVRLSPFGGSLTQAQVDGMNYLLEVWEWGWEKPNPRDGNKWLAYCLATAYHETGAKMTPVAENGGKAYGNPPKSYWNPVGPYKKAYYGRGHVQLTWEDNYKKGQQRLKDVYGLDVLIHPHPELMLDDRPSALILFDGMSVGWFTGVGLPKYFNGTTEDPYNARRVVNGTDQAQKIAGYYQNFKVAIVTAPDAPAIAEPETPPAEETLEPDHPVLTVSSHKPVRIRLGDNVSMADE
jgi:putative chitinase